MSGTPEEDKVSREAHKFSLGRAEFDVFRYPSDRVPFGLCINGPRAQRILGGDGNPNGGLSNLILTHWAFVDNDSVWALRWMRATAV